MTILITGANGFIGKNLAVALQSSGAGELLLFDADTDPALLEPYSAACDFVFHLAGVNRPTDPADFWRGNTDFTAQLCKALQRGGRRCPVVFSSSIQAARQTPYGQSKQAGEQQLFAYGAETGAPVFVYRLPNVFGKWCRPGYNSVVATFCHNIARGMPIRVDDAAAPLPLAYIDDVVAAFCRALAGDCTRDGDFCTVAPVYHTTVGELAALLASFRQSRQSLAVPDMADGLTRKLYATYLSALPKDAFAYPLLTHADQRGSFTEMLRTPDRGQVSVNVSLPGVTKGNHWHHTKNEKFLVVHGQGLIRLRQLGQTEVLTYAVSGDALQVVDIPPGYTHSIANAGTGELITVMWASEPFDPEHPDTYYEEV